ncbi:hypothetical protein MAPG_00476 [Magnaporthiopsis poae ATCC 64411]|uniref:Uncharacterized protein n=1 Tax=Magnaporthiopsis poae (strain ATCC 64411 / 73-15) TaxID=644358 RepID=A0A0C4DL39_MAGP6|nr:hypothetical protein MAPG_00476 [Magnaporthiopsis poae ATCC 64411]
MTRRVGDGSVLSYHVVSVLAVTPASGRAPWGRACRDASGGKWCSGCLRLQGVVSQAHGRSPAYSNRSACLLHPFVVCRPCANPLWGRAEGLRRRGCRSKFNFPWFWRLISKPMMQGSTQDLRTHGL